MSLSPLLRFVYNHGLGQVITRGKKIFFTKGVSLLDVDHHIDQARFRVRNDVYQNFYTVTIQNFHNHDHLSVRCQCPYNLGEICRHEVAALFYLNDLVQSGYFQDKKATFNQKHTVLRMRDINPAMLRIFAGAEMMDQAASLMDNNAIDVIQAKNEKVTAKVQADKKTYDIVLFQNEDRYFDTSCPCEEIEHPVCVHKVALYLYLHKKHGPNYFRTLQNFDDQKNKLLQLYGYSLADNLEGKFDFVYENGKPFLRVLDPSIQKVTKNSVPEHHSKVQEVETSVLEEHKHVALVLNPYYNAFPNVAFTLVQGELQDDQKAFVDTIETLTLNKYLNLDSFEKHEQNWINQLRKIFPEELLRYLKKNLPFGDYIDENVLNTVPDSELCTALWEYLLPKYKSLFTPSENTEPIFVQQSQQNPISSKSILPLTLAQNWVKPRLEIQLLENSYSIQLVLEIGHHSYTSSQFKSLNAALFVVNNETLCCVEKLEELEVLQQFLDLKNTNIAPADWAQFLEHTLVPWQKKIEIVFPEALKDYSQEEHLQIKLQLIEHAEALYFKPLFCYGQHIAHLGEPTQIVQAQEGKLHIIERDSAAEMQFCNMLKTMHDNMIYSLREKQYYLHSKHVFKSNWFQHFDESLQEKGIEIVGYQSLKTLKINPNKIKTQYHVSSQIDWFETTIDLSFGDQKVSLSALKKALSNKEQQVKLADGSIGIIPQEVLQKIGLLTKMGEVDGDKIKLKKIHFSVLDELLPEVDATLVQQELESKKERLESIIGHDYSKIEAPEALKNILRPYQLIGFQWLMFLKEAGWGGILADDMGLGKTIQTLAWLSHYKAQYPQAQFLVICPTSLTYNWEKEIQKFTPHLKSYIHHGVKRSTSAKAFADYDIIISSYGTIRSDIKLFMDLHFDYVVLDESQAIKNPKSLIAKAVQLLPAQNKLALSGTPIQNNTFDLYAQMNFLNPGMLGSKDFFMSEFAMPIDKFQEKEAKEQLRKLVYPFMLRRTKEQVAKDLPEKTESVLFCEMGKEQRKIYEMYRSLYQSKILGMIDEVGLHKSQFHILQGLTKLRQICDSPAILKEDEAYENHSVKIEELTRELLENTGEHKALVFSQFLGMLALIKKELDKQQIPYVYFDGASSVQEREKAIQEFQNTDNCKVFLISLKAGGVGLNLTAADYVYIVDPWWNPAVEQQAIDRTHRIGQTRPVFAYRFICKNTIEEKMLQLQERKRLLAEELIADDNTVMKRLTRDDIAFLFS